MQATDCQQYGVLHTCSCNTKAWTQHYCGLARPKLTSPCSHLEQTVNYVPSVFHKICYQRCFHGIYSKWNEVPTQSLLNLHAFLKMTILITGAPLATSFLTHTSWSVCYLPVTTHWLHSQLLSLTESILASSPGHTQLFNVFTRTAGVPGIKRLVTYVTVRRVVWRVKIKRGWTKGQGLSECSRSKQVLNKAL